MLCFFFFSSRRRHTRWTGDWSSDVCSSDLIDEAMAGFCKEIQVVLNADGSVTVADDGRGIPVDIHPKYGAPGVEIVLTRMHSGGKFERKMYRVSGGLHGVGLSVVNGLSEWLEVRVKRDGQEHRMRFARGKKT